jgi:hypothetical protein
MKPPTQIFEDHSDSCIHAEVERVTAKCPRCETQLETKAGREVHLTDTDCIKALLVRLKAIEEYVDKNLVTPVGEKSDTFDQHKSEAMESVMKCTGHLVHDEFTLCPVHDHRREP